VIAKTTEEMLGAARSIISLLSLFNQLWERAIPKSDRGPLIMSVGFISNHVIQELSQLVECGTPLGYLIGMTSEICRV
jgi:hypothetical protein